MWIVHAYAAIIVICTAPGMPDESCKGVAIEGFVSREACDAAVGNVGEIIGQVVTAGGKRIQVNAKCVSITVDREA